MGELKSITIKIPDDIFEEMKELVERGRFSSLSDLVRCAVRELLKSEGVLKEDESNEDHV